MRGRVWGQAREDQGQARSHHTMYRTVGSWTKESFWRVGLGLQWIAISEMVVIPPNTAVFVKPVITAECNPDLHIHFSRLGRVAKLADGRCLNESDDSLYRRSQLRHVFRNAVLIGRNSYSSPSMIDWTAEKRAPFGTTPSRCSDQQKDCYFYIRLHKINLH